MKRKRSLQHQALIKYVIGYNNNKYVTYDGVYFNYVSYKYDIPCSKLIDLITVDNMLKQYVTIHETGLEHTAEYLYEVFIQDKIKLNSIE